MSKAKIENHMKESSGSDQKGAHPNMEVEKVVVTVEASEPSFQPQGQLGVPFLTERFTKMVMVTGGPKPTFDEKPVEHLNLQDIRDIRDAISAFSIQAGNQRVGA
jgi:hypothetical protein